MIWGYVAYGEDVGENLTEEISESFPIFGMLPSLGLLANVAITAPLFFYCFFSVAWLSKQKEAKRKQQLERSHFKFYEKKSGSHTFYIITR